MENICADCLWADTCNAVDMESAALNGCDHYDRDSMGYESGAKWRDEIDIFEREWRNYIAQYDAYYK